MHLRSITVRGFKSFAQKVVLRFEPGVTVIVGPNGSGKSNITDAVLWVLGEQSPRSLRGALMEDVIFAGSASKQALGAAQVSICLDNSDSSVPIDFTEVTISRRLFRSGESEYQINGAACRLIDIHEMLSDTGLGREMYSVVSQGRLEDILNRKPSERRQLLEEAAGVLKHKRRKERALKKLISMQSNLSRGKDILREVDRRLTPLKKQANQAVRHNQLIAELKDAQVAKAVCELRGFQSTWDELASDEKKSKELADKLKIDLGEAQSGITAMESELEAKGFLVGDIGEYRRHLEGLLARINSGLLLLEEKGKNLVGKLSEFRQVIHQYESVIETRGKELKDLNGEKSSLEGELTLVYQQLGEARRETESAKKDGRFAEEKFAKVDFRLAQKRNQAAKITEELNQLTSVLESTSEKLSFLREHQAVLAKKQSSILSEKKTVAKELKKLSAKLPEKNDHLEKLKRDIDKLNEKRSEKAKAVGNHTLKCREKEATISALEALDKKARTESSWFDDNRDNLPEMIGTVAEMITVKPKYAHAIGVILGLDIYAAVAKDFKSAVKAYKVIGDSGDYPFRVLPQGKTVEIPEALPRLKSALEVVDGGDLGRQVITSLLANVWITESMSEFLRSKQKVPDGGVVVDLKGDYVDSRGMIAREPAGRDLINSLDTKRELAQLQNDLAKLIGLLEKREQEQADIDRELEDQKKKALASTAEMQKTESRIMAVSLRIQSLDKEYDRLDAEQEDIADRIERKEKGLKETKQNIHAISDESKKIKAELAGYEEELKVKRADFTEKIEMEKIVAAKLSKAQVSIASLTERQTHLKSKLISAGDDLQRARKVLTEQKKMVEATEELRLRIQPVHDLYTGLRIQAENWAVKLEATANKEQAGATSMRAELRHRQQRLTEITTDLDLAKEELKAKEVAKAQVEIEVNQVTKHLVEELQVALETVMNVEDKGVDPEGWQKKEDQIRVELDQIGPINQIAADEYSKLEQRQRFLGQQIDDLVKSQKALQKVVKAIDKKVAAKFQITFDEVNANFGRVFNELFPGGLARLVLVEDEFEPGDPGIEIEAQPHGKRLQSLNLLSGGERALVGLAILFALYYTRPSPFYILDEVEAALDDVNLQRFTKLIKKLKSATQFIIITHQRRTMEVADCIYGVSMQADGVSKVISQKLFQEETIDERQSETKLAATAIGQPEQVQEQP